MRLRTSAPRLALAALRVRRGGVTPAPSMEWMAQAVKTGRFGPLLFYAAYVAIEMCGIPSTALAAAAGVLYETHLAVALILGSSLTAALLAFTIGRTLLRPRLVKKIHADPKLRAIDAAVRENGFRIMLLLRLVPMPPAINYVYGATSAKRGPYMAATALGFLPGTLFCAISARAAGSSLKSRSMPASAWAVAALMLALLLYGGAAAAKSIRSTLAEYGYDDSSAPATVSLSR